MSDVNRPVLVCLPFVEDDPNELWERCCNSLKEWKEDSLISEEIRAKMKSYEKERALNLVWMSNKLESTLPEGLSKYETFKILKKIYDGETNATIEDILSNHDITRGGALLEDAERECSSRRQLVQHLMAYKKLKEWAVSATPVPLSEEIIKDIHQILMTNLKTEDEIPVNAGSYREIPVHSGDHVFPNHDCVPRNMKKIVDKYNSKASAPHDPYQLASWLLFEVISLHPFIDGNGRLCRLLWCASLMRDGLPFPLTITSGHKRARRHYIQCIERDRRPQCSNQPSLTTLTLVSVTKAWDNFWCNLKYELMND